MLSRIFLTVLLLLTACSQSDSPDTADTVRKAAPALWKVDNGKGGQGWLFGTVLMLPKETQWQGPVIDKAIRDSSALVLEASGLEDVQAVGRVFASLGVRRGLPPVSQRIDPALRPQLDSAIAAGTVPRHVYDAMESWAAMLTLAAGQSTGMGLEKGAGVEQVLTTRFRADDKPISGLETVAGQLGLFDTLPESEQRAMLNATLRNGASSPAEFEKMFNAWLYGDDMEVQVNGEDGILVSPVIREVLLDARNRRWATQIAAMLDRNERPFVAVGAAHIPGTVGVAQLLRAKGFTVSRLQ